MTVPQTWVQVYRNSRKCSAELHAVLACRPGRCLESQPALCSMDLRKLRLSTTGCIKVFKTLFYSTLVTEARVVTGVQPQRMEGNSPRSPGAEDRSFPPQWSLRSN